MAYKTRNGLSCEIKKRIKVFCWLAKEKNKTEEMLTQVSKGEKLRISQLLNLYYRLILVQVHVPMQHRYYNISYLQFLPLFSAALCPQECCSRQIPFWGDKEPLKFSKSIFKKKMGSGVHFRTQLL